MSRDKDRLKVLVDEARELAERPSLSPIQSKRLDDVLRQAKALRQVIDNGAQIDAVTDRMSAALNGEDTPETEDGFKAGVGRITGAALKAVWDANSKNGSIPSGNQFKVPGVGYKDVDGGGHLTAPYRDPEEYTTPMKPAFLTSIVPGKMIGDGFSGTNDFTYIVQKTRTNLAAVVPDGATKPTSIYKFEEKSGTLDTLGHLSEPIKNRILEDKSGLTAWLYSEMVLGLDLAQESELVDVVLNDVNVQSQLFSVDTLTTIRKAVTKLQTVYVRPDFLAISIKTAEAMDLERYTFDGHFIFEGPRTAGPSGPVWSVPLIINDAIPASTMIMGSAQAGLRRFVNGQARWMLDTLSGFDVNTTRSRLETRSKSVVVRPFALVVLETGTGS